VAVCSEGIVVLGPHPGDVLRRLTELGTKGLGIGAERCQRALKAEERLDLLAKQESGLDFFAQRAHLALEPLEAFPGMGQSRLCRGLGLDDPLYLLFGHGELGAESLQSRHLPFDVGAALTQPVQLGYPIQDWGERPELVGGAFGAGDQGFKRRGDVSAVRIDGYDRVVFTTATFEKTDQLGTPRENAGDLGSRAGDDFGTKGDGGLTATRMPRMAAPARVGTRNELAYANRYREGGLVRGLRRKKSTGPSASRPTRTRCWRGARFRAGRRGHCGSRL
jgi:hypothetical protein